MDTQTIVKTGFDLALDRTTHSGYTYHSHKDKCDWNNSSCDCHLSADSK